MRAVDKDESVMDMNKRAIAGAAGVATVAAISIGGVAVATGGADSDEVPLSSSEGKDASAAALEETGGGTVNSIEKDNENGAVWEVEVTKENGSTVDVRLSDNFDVVAVEGDNETEADDLEGPGAADDDSDKDDGTADDAGDDESEADDEEGPGATDDDSDVGDDNSDKD